MRRGASPGASGVGLGLTGGAWRPLILLAAAVLLLPGAAAQGPADVTGPRVRLVEPDRGDLLSGNVVLRAEVEGPPGLAVRRVEFLADGVPLAVDETPPFEALWSGIDPQRDHLLRVTAVMEDGSRAYGLLSIPVLGLVERVSVTGRSPDFVLLDVTFVDPQGHPVTDVRKDEVTVLEDGEPQVIDVFAPDDRPLAVQLLLDASVSTASRWSDLGGSTWLFAETLREGDRAGVVAFNNQIVDLAPLGSSSFDIETATAGFRAWGGTTRLYDALSQGALHALAREETLRRALVVLTDSMDFGSTLEIGDAEDYLLRAAVEVHGVLLFSEQQMVLQNQRTAPATIQFKRGGLVQLARSTGGGGYDAGSLPLEEVFLRIGERLRAQYLLGYYSVSPRPRGKERRVEVRLGRPGGFEALARSGHFGGETLEEYLRAEMGRGPERRRIQAVRAAARTRSSGALVAVVEALSQGKGLTAGVSREARLALLDLGLEAVPYLRAALEGADPVARDRSAEVLVDLLLRLGRREDPSELAEGIRLLGDGDAGAGRRVVGGIEAGRLPEPVRERLQELRSLLEP